MEGLQAGRIQLYRTGTTQALPAVREGRARALAVASRQRLAVAPDIPTVAETVAGFAVESWYALLGPRDLPEDALARLDRAAAEAARLAALGAEPAGSISAELAARLREEDAKWNEAARAAGLGAE